MEFTYFPTAEIGSSALDWILLEIEISLHWKRTVPRSIIRAVLYWDERDPRMHAPARRNDGCALVAPAVITFLQVSHRSHDLWSRIIAQSAIQIQLRTMQPVRIHKLTLGISSAAARARIRVSLRDHTRRRRMHVLCTYYTRIHVLCTTALPAA